MPNLVSDVIRCSNCAMWQRVEKDSIWGVCTIHLGSYVDIDVDNDEGSTNSCFVDEIRTDEEFFCANFLSIDENVNSKLYYQFPNFMFKVPTDE